MQSRLHHCDGDLRDLLAHPGEEPRLHGARLPRATRADHRRERRPADHPVGELVDELVTAEEAAGVGLAERSEPEVGVLHPDARGRSVGGGRLGGVEVGVLEEDLLLQATEPGRRIDAQLLGQDGAHRLEGAQRVGLTSGSVQGEHLQRSQLLAVRVLASQPLQLDRRGHVLTQGQSCRHRSLDGDEAQLLEPGGVGLQVGVVGEVLEGTSAPQGQRRFQIADGAGRVAVESSSCFAHPRFELERVEALLVDADAVAGAVPLDHLAEGLAQLGHVRLEGVARAIRRGRAPHPVDQPIDGDDGVGLRQEQGQHELLLRAAERALDRCRTPGPRPNGR